MAELYWENIGIAGIAAAVPERLIDDLNFSDDNCFRAEDSTKWWEKKLLMSGFGVGLSWGTVVTKLDNCTICELVEI